MMTPKKTTHSRIRKETDSLGEISVPAEKYWGAQTERSLRHFSIGSEKMPLDVVYAITTIKKACAIVNHRYGHLPKSKMQAILWAADEILKGKWDEHFPTSVWQTGSGTQCHMNVNEVLANRANELLERKLGAKYPVHPNDHVNLSQSTNDVFPTAMHLSAEKAVREKLLPSLTRLLRTIKGKERSFAKTVKLGRTHWQDAVPITLGQEFSGYAAQIEFNRRSIQGALSELYYLAIGGTAVGTGLNAPKQFGGAVSAEIARLTRQPFQSVANKMAAIASHEAIVMMSGALKMLATSLMKIANDIRLMSSGPDGGLGELILPVNEPGSSMMPGKVNPTQCEALMMIGMQVIGNDVTVTLANAHGELELNVFKPVMIFNLLQSIQLLSDGVSSFTEHLVKGLKCNAKRMRMIVDQSKMLATILTPILGYDKTVEVVRFATRKDISVKQACVSLGLLSDEAFARCLKSAMM